MGLKLGMQLREIDTGLELRFDPRGPRRKQQLIQALLVQFIRQGPRQLGCGRFFPISMNGRLADGATARNLVLVQTQAES